MKKAIVVISGSPTGKNIFKEVAMENVWVKNVNPKDRIAKVTKSSLYGKDDGSETFHKYLAAQMSLLNKYFDFTKTYIADEIEKFLADDGEKFDESGKEYNRYILMIHGVSPDIATSIEEMYGAFTLYICDNGERVFTKNMKEKERSQYISETALTLNMEDPDFRNACRNFVLTLTN